MEQYEDNKNYKKFPVDWTGWLFLSGHGDSHISPSFSSRFYRLVFLLRWHASLAIDYCTFSLQLYDRKKKKISINFLHIKIPAFCSILKFLFVMPWKKSDYCKLSNHCGYFREMCTVMFGLLYVSKCPKGIGERRIRGTASGSHSLAA